MKILVADEDPANRESARETLKTHDLTVIESYSEAMKELEKGPAEYDAALVSDFGFESDYTGSHQAGFLLAIQAIRHNIKLPWYQTVPRKSTLPTSKPASLVLLNHANYAPRSKLTGRLPYFFGVRHFWKKPLKPIAPGVGGLAVATIVVMLNIIMTVTVATLGIASVCLVAVLGSPMRTRWFSRVKTGATLSAALQAAGE